MFTCVRLCVHLCSPVRSCAVTCAHVCSPVSSFDHLRSPVRSPAFTCAVLCDHLRSPVFTCVRLCSPVCTYAVTCVLLCSSVCSCVRLCSPVRPPVSTCVLQMCSLVLRFGHTMVGAQRRGPQEWVHYGRHRRAGPSRGRAQSCQKREHSLYTPRRHELAFQRKNPQAPQARESGTCLRSPNPPGCLRQSWSHRLPKTRPAPRRQEGRCRPEVSDSDSDFLVGEKPEPRRIEGKYDHSQQNYTLPHAGPLTHTQRFKNPKPRHRRRKQAPGKAIFHTLRPRAASWGTLAIQTGTGPGTGAGRRGRGKGRGRRKGRGRGKGKGTRTGPGEARPSPQHPERCG